MAELRPLQTPKIPKTPRTDIPMAGDSIFDSVRSMLAQRQEQNERQNPLLSSYQNKLLNKYMATNPEGVAKLMQKYGGSGGGASAGGMDPTQIVRLMYDQGITDPNRLSTLLAISRGESGWNPGAHAVDSDDDSWGLFQINVRPEANPRYASWNLADPAQNVRAMVELSGGGANLRPWTVYTSGKYRQYLAEAQAIVNAFLAGR